MVTAHSKHARDKQAQQALGAFSCRYTFQVLLWEANANDIYVEARHKTTGVVRMLVDYDGRVVRYL